MQSQKAVSAYLYKQILPFGFARQSSKPALLIFAGYSHRSVELKNVVITVW